MSQHSSYTIGELSIPNSQVKCCAIMAVTAGGTGQYFASAGMEHGKYWLYARVEEPLLGGCGCH